jgi:hypothetical protein
MRGIYKLRCGMCSGVYIGQTGRSFRIRYKEHLNDAKCNRDKTGYSQHILNTQHEYSKDITAMEVLEVHRKSPFLIAFERFHTYIKTKLPVRYSMNNCMTLTTPFLKFCSYDHFSLPPHTPPLSHTFPPTSPLPLFLRVYLELIARPRWLLFLPPSSALAQHTTFGEFLVFCFVFEFLHTFLYIET